MFNLPFDDRLSSWASHRVLLNTCENPLEEVWEFWRAAPFIPYNIHVDPYYQQSWPTPWQLIENNKYDDFTKILMIGWTLKLLTRYRDSVIELRTLIDEHRTKEYNVVCVDNSWVLNFSDEGPVSIGEIPEEFQIQNVIILSAPR